MFVVNFADDEIRVKKSKCIDWKIHVICLLFIIIIVIKMLALYT